MSALPATGPLALYIHWPFCVSKCPYCDFNSHVRPDVDHQRWRAALLAELAYEASLTPGRHLGSIFFGGGTPSLMHPETVAALIGAARDLWPVMDDPEITLEANPSSVEAGRFADFADAGVNRVSLGLQALDDEALRMLGRAHDVGEGLAALEIAQRHFPRVSIDLIHSRPGQTPTQWEAELRRALSFGTGHVSAYQLIIEAGTRFHTLFQSGRLILPDEEDASLMFEQTAALCAEAGLELYEISNHARPDEQSRHNLAYWTYAPYVGIGPGAHGRRNHIATERHRRPETWLTEVEQHGHAIASQTVIDSATAAEEALMMGLRLSAGIDPELFAAHTGVALADAVDPAARARLESWGLLHPGERLRTTAQGRGVLDAIIVQLAGGAETITAIG